MSSLICTFNIWLLHFKYRIFNCCKSIKYILLFTYARVPPILVKLLDHFPNLAIVVHIRGQAPDSEGGGVIWTRYSMGEDFFGFFLGGDRFFDLEGGDIL